MRWLSGLALGLVFLAGCSSSKIIEPPPLTPEEEKRLEEKLKSDVKKEGSAQPSGDLPDK
jgi:hypothetical protein